MKRRLPCRAHVAPVVKAHFHGDFDGGGAVVGVEAARQARRRDAVRALRQLDHRLVGEAGENHLLELSNCARTAALMRGLAWPNRFTHQELMASR